MDSSGHDPVIIWTRWLWIPIVVPGLILGALAWRAVSGERQLLERQISETRVRLAAQMAGLLQGAAQQQAKESREELTRWVMEPSFAPVPLPPDIFESAVIFEDGTLLPDGKDSLPLERVQLNVELQEALQALESGRTLLGLARSEAFLMDALHASPDVLDSNLWKQMPRLDSNLSPALSFLPHWRPLMADLQENLRRRMEVHLANRRDSQILKELSHTPVSGIVSKNGRSWMVLAPPDLPQGAVVVAGFSPQRLRMALEPRLFYHSNTQDSTIRIGIQDEHDSVFGLVGARPHRAPDVRMPIPGGFPNWSVVVWTDEAGGEDAARFRAILLSILMTLSLMLLCGSAILAMRALRAQRQVLSMKTDFVSNVTHELKTPLTAIHLYAELLAGGRVGERAQEFGGMVLREARRLESMIEGILAFARHEAGAGSARSVVTDFSGLVRESCESLRPRAQGRGMDLLSTLAPASVLGDPALLRSIIENLLDNAIKYGGERGTIRVSLASEAGRVILRVSDEGPGIPRAEQRHVFERFYRGGAEMTRSVPGTGLGLAIVHKSVEIHGGTVELQSEPGRGTTMIVNLPAAEVLDG